MLRLVLKRGHYEAFRAGTKRVEIRRYGPWFNERRYFPGRPIVLTYRRANVGPFLLATVAGFERAPAAHHPEACAVYPGLRPDEELAVIHLAVEREITLAEEQALRREWAAGSTTA
jgi:hypothetical protein